MKSVFLNTDKELRIFMDPMRQRMLRRLETAQEGMTAKQLADCFAITPSSAKHHLEQLESIGLVALSHTELVRGITAKYYAAVPAQVNVGTAPETRALRDTLAAQSFALHAQGFSAYSKTVEGVSPQALNGPDFFGFYTDGVVHLSTADAAALKQKVSDFLKAHATPAQGTVSLSFLLTAYPAAKEEV